MTPHAVPSRETDETAAAVRGSLRRLAALDREAAQHVADLAFLLSRVAAADRTICPRETARMEVLLQEQCALDRAQAILVVEIARHRIDIADCGVSYGISRELRRTTPDERRGELLDSLVVVATADGLVTRSERERVRQLGCELGFSPDEVEAHVNRA